MNVYTMRSFKDAGASKVRTTTYIKVGSILRASLYASLPTTSKYTLVRRNNMNTITRWKFTDFLAVNSGDCLKWRAHFTRRSHGHIYWGVRRCFGPIVIGKVLEKIK